MGASSLRARFFVACLALGSASSCQPAGRVDRTVVYPEQKVQARELALRVVDQRPAPPVHTREVSQLPADFEARARERLMAVAVGEGEALEVSLHVATAGAFEIVDARGEMTRVEVAFDVETRVAGGPTLRRARTQWREDIPRAEAESAEIARVLSETALHAFDRYWASEATIDALNRDLAAYRAAR